jgi:hypothetical protein
VGDGWASSETELTAFMFMFMFIALNRDEAGYYYQRYDVDILLFDIRIIFDYPKFLSESRIQHTVAYICKL